MAWFPLLAATGPAAGGSRRSQPITAQAKGEPARGRLPLRALSLARNHEAEAAMALVGSSNADQYATIARIDCRFRSRERFGNPVHVPTWNFSHLACCPKHNLGRNQNGRNRDRGRGSSPRQRPLTSAPPRSARMRSAAGPSGDSIDPADQRLGLPCKPRGQTSLARH